MNIFENFRIALRALTANKLRSGLTMLGIIIGVAAVVALMAVGKGATSGITSQVEGLGTNLISVSSGRFFQQPGVQAQSLLYSDYQAIEKAVGNLAEITPAYQTMANVINGDRQSDYTITGVQANFTAVNSYTVARGRFITEQDNNGQARVAVIGSQAAEDLFSSLNPVGREIQIDGITFKVVGVLESKGTSGFTSQDDIVLIPLETGYERLFGGRALSGGKRTLTGISLSAHDSAQTDNIISTVEYTLRREHGLTLRDDLGFVVSSQTQMLSTLSTITGTMTALLGAIAAISLLVGGIGIMNITLVSVRERTQRDRATEGGRCPAKRHPAPIPCRDTYAFDYGRHCWHSTGGRYRVGGLAQWRDFDAYHSRYDRSSVRLSRAGRPVFWYLSRISGSRLTSNRSPAL